MRDAIYIAGPTASGKSSLALLLAERIGGEIISVDSMQVYRGLDIGTAKPTATERARVPHHLIDVANLDESFDVAKFLELARPAEAVIRERGGVPIYCGGTGLYFKALVAGIGGSEGPQANPELRRELEQTALTDLLEELRRRDPQTFERIDRANPRRVIRAVEVIRQTGAKFSEQRADWSSGTQTGRWFGLEWERSDLVQRIDRRVDVMFERGLVAETRELLERGLAENRTALQALGYRQVVEHLRGERELDETIALVKIKTRQFAKRQMTWFKRQLQLEWLRLDPAASEKVILERVVGLVAGEL